LPESHYVTAWISGLREDIKNLVLSKNHKNLLEVFQYAKHIEVVLDYQFKKKSLLKAEGTMVSNHFKGSSLREKIEEMQVSNMKEDPKIILIEHQRVLSFYFKCAEKYYPRH
jgi:hypothetical protein